MFQTETFRLAALRAVFQPGTIPVAAADLFPPTWSETGRILSLISQFYCEPGQEAKTLEGCGFWIGSAYVIGKQLVMSISKTSRIRQKLAVILRIDGMDVAKRQCAFGDCNI